MRWWRTCCWWRREDGDGGEDGFGDSGTAESLVLASGVGDVAPVTAVVSGRFVVVLHFFGRVDWFNFDALFCTLNKFLCTLVYGFLLFFLWVFGSFVRFLLRII